MQNKIPHEYYQKVKNHFNGDDKKTWEWFQKSNSSLGFFSPLNLISLGKANKVKKFIDDGMREKFF